MITDEKYLKRMELVIKARGGKQEIHTTVYVDSSIVDTVLDRGKMEDVDSVQLLEREDDVGWWYCRKAEVDDLVKHLKKANSRYWRLF